MTSMEWRQVAESLEWRLETLKHYAHEIFRDEDQARRWLGSINLAIGRGVAPVTACADAHGFYEAMAELARIERFHRREAAKRARHHRPIEVPLDGGLEAA